MGYGHFVTGHFITRTLRYIGILREVSEDANGNFERTNAKSYKLSAKFAHNYSLASIYFSLWLRICYAVANWAEFDCHQE